MAGLDIVLLQDAITSEVKRFLGDDTLVLEDTIPDDFPMPRDPYTMKLRPYVVLRYGPLRPSYTGKGFGGPRHDEYYGTCDVMAIAPNGRSARLLGAILVDHLIGFRPDGVSPMGMRTDAGDPAQFVVSSNESRPTQMISSTRLRFTVNSRGIGERIPNPDA